MSPAPAGIDVWHLRPICRDLGKADPIALLELTGGSNRSFRIDLADGDALVLKTYDEFRGKGPAKEAFAARLLEGLELPVTRYLMRDETLTRLPVRFAVTTWLAGVAAGSLRDEPDIADIYRQMGALLRRLHTVSLPAYGHFDETGVAAPVATNAQNMAREAAYAFGQFRRYGADEALAARLEQIVATRSELFAQSRGPVFAHDDLHPNNVLALRGEDGELHISGLIDFGNARAADALSDLAKTLFICEHESPGSRAAILDGYGPIDHPDPDAALWLYTLLHRVVMWWWLRHIGVIGDGEPHELMIALSEMAEPGRP